MILKCISCGKIIKSIEPRNNTSTLLTICNECLGIEKREEKKEERQRFEEFSGKNR